MTTGKSVRLFLVDGTSGGLTTAEIMNWTGHVITSSRTDLPALIKREEAQRTGVYILLGDDPDSTGDPAAYIGEGDDVSKRLYSHNRPEEAGGKDFWNRVVVLTSKDPNLTKAHVRYLESRLIEIATSAKRSRLQNSTAPGTIALPESDQSDMEYYIDQAKIILPVLGVNILRAKAKRTAPAASVDPSETSRSDATTPEFTLTVNRHGIRATAQELDGEFTVLAGSLAKAEWSRGSAHATYAALHEALLRDGTLIPTDDPAVVQFSRDHPFSSPSSASAVVTGRPSNGRKDWIETTTGESYGRWQDRRAEESMTAASTGEAPDPEGPEGGA
ncbi:DUF4357 domain-containing protein [Gordonia iterans]|uniref:DUF4357 domain-containing protein n=1 Tax=Gordonia iterans TaxID=1004901 RepID=A0A2S0KCG0_9ACTN|nr:GIY-YIG nuclease family protein [Gordonia iterans]AVL99345.1 DUF4357 domain-containing protein [Gordonia iterans]